MRLCISLVLTLLISAFAAGQSEASGAAQTPSPADQEAATTFVKTVSEVNVVFTVVDSHGRFV